MRNVLILVCLFSCFHVFTQNNVTRCSTDQMVAEQLLLDPDKRIILEQLESFTAEFIQHLPNGRISDTTYIIPVVVHVIHNYGDERINMGQVESAIKAMCEDFSKTNDDLVDENGDFTPSINNLGSDTVNILSPPVHFATSSSYSWSFENNKSVKKNDTICIINHDGIDSYIIADDIGNNRFAGGLLNILTIEENTIIEPNTIIAQIITTEARGFEDIVADIGIEFRLATKDPDGNCSTGVTYNQSALTAIGGENVKDDTYWDNSRYLNIWTVESVASGAAAYAYYPGSAPKNHEGILCQYDYFGTTGESSDNNWQRHTMSHEAGHYFNLAHPWGSSNNSALEDNCATDDNVEDTPNTIGASGCYSFDSQISCGSLDNVANIMDYTNCAYMFTKGQKARVLAALYSFAGDRNNLWTQENLELTGTDDLHWLSNPHATCIPTPDFQIIGEGIGALGSNNSFSVSFEDLSYNVPSDDITYLWSFPGAEPSTSSEKTPTVLYTESGQHSVSLVVSNDYGSRELIKENYITILDRIEAPFEEDFESSTFPISESADKPSWCVLDNFPTETNWHGYNNESVNNRHLRIRSKSFTAGLEVKQVIYAPEIDCSSQENSNDNPFGIYFDLAYAKRLPYEDLGGNSVIPDELTVWRNHPPSSYWARRATFDIEELITNQNTYFNEYVPSDFDWQQRFVNLGSSAGRESVLVRFEFTGRGYLSTDTLIMTNTGGEYVSNNIGGNWLYIDNLRVGNFEEILEESKQESMLEDTRVFDLFGRQYYNKTNLKTGFYIQNKKLVFIKND